MSKARKGRAALVPIVAAAAVGLVAPAAAHAAPAAPAADPAPIFCQYRVTYSKSAGLPVRARPSTSATVVYRLKKGTLVRAASNFTVSNYRELSDYNWASASYLARTSAPCLS